MQSLGKKNQKSQDQNHNKNVFFFGGLRCTTCASPKTVQNLPIRVDKSFVDRSFHKNQLENERAHQQASTLTLSLETATFFCRNVLLFHLAFELFPFLGCHIPLCG